MRHGSVFSGIGGFEIAAQSVGWENVFHCELNKFGQRVLKYHYPNSVSYDDITKTDFTIWRERIDILTGGFPCQDASTAKQNGGGQKGLQGSRTGLYFEMLRAIDEIRPRFIVAENVANIFRTNNGADWYTIINELGRLGYNAEWRICRASEVGASHHRARVYLVAYNNSIRIRRLNLSSPMWERRYNRSEGTLSEMLHRLGYRGKLNQAFALWMMAFPKDWTELPFQNGEIKQ